MMNKLRARLTRFMAGRYGADRMGQFLMGTSFAILVVGMFVREPWVEIAAILLLLICYYRMFSKNIGKRYAEEQKFVGLRFIVMEKFRKMRYKVLEKKEYHIYKCPGCGQKIRVPKGKGKISIHCPKCNTDFIKKS